MRCSHLQSRHPRRGQALLLAVLIMIFAALLSASFIAIVSVNLNQTARQTDKNRAVVSAKAGIDYVTRQLAQSEEGEKWNPLIFRTVSQSGDPMVISAVPAPSDSRYNFYYSALDRAQGWAGSYAKFPNPLNATGQNAGPQFLAKVERVPTTLASTNPEFDKIGAIKITVIGLSPEDETAYSRSVAYFGGYRNAPIGQTMRTVSNWDFLNNRGFVAQGANTANNGTNATTPLLDVTNAQGDFLKLGLPFSITLSDPRNGVPARSAVVTAVTGTRPNFALTLAQPLTTATAATPTTRIELAANLGAPVGIDYDNNPATQPTSFNPTAANSVTDIRFRLSDPDPDPNRNLNAVDGARINGSLVWSGEMLATRLRPASLSFGNTGLVPGSVFASGVIAPEVVNVSTVDVPNANGTNVDNLIASRNLPTRLTDTTDGIFLTRNGNRALKFEMVSDAWDRLKGVASTGGVRAIADFRPPVIDAGAGVERYRNLTRFSKPYDDRNLMTPPLLASASLYGQGEGIYIDNLSDREKIGTAADTQREMTQSELVKMWLSSTGVTDNFTRLGTAELATLNTKSLEEQHLRGWVGPDEFRARGVEIELGNNLITITRDPRDDNRTTNPDGTSGAANALGPIASKTWKDATGALRPGVYRQVLPWPTNGVIFAEGNVRIKGQALNAPRSLTVVSMNNIYIEDSLSADADSDGILTTGAPRKVLLLAKRNVVMNPTRALGRPDAQTVTKSGATFTVVPAPTDVDLDVFDVADFRVGDVVRASTIAAGVETTQAQGIVKAIVDIDTITVTPLTAGTVTTGAFLKTPNAPTQNLPVIASLATSRRIGVSAITSATDIIQRRVAFGAPSPNLRLAFDHQGKRVDAFTAAVSDTAPQVRPTSPIYFSNKGILLPGPPAMAPYLDNKASIVTTPNKKIRGQFTDPTPGTEEFPNPVPANESDAQAQTLSIVSGAMNAATPHTAMPPTAGSVGWQYNTSVANPQNLPASPFNNIPFFYLAGVGNRFDFAATNLEGRKDINPSTTMPAGTPAGAPYNVPFANTIGLFTNGGQSTLLNESYNVSAMTYERTNQFGFANYMSAPSEEDILTGDQSFYQADAGKSTVDSRQLSTALAAGPNTSNSIFLSQNNLPIPLPVNAVNALNYPDYRTLGLKTEDVGLTADATTGVVTVNSIQSGHAFTINAFVYAQTGSWFVIPGELFNDRLKVALINPPNLMLTNTFLDANDNGTAEAGEFITDASGNGYPDLNRNGVIEDTEKFAMARYSRQNYAINFTGAISENQTALVNDAGTGATAAKGAVADWMNKWATTTFNPTLTPTLTNNRIQYIFDPTVVLNTFQKDDLTTPVDETDYGFRLPQTSEVFNVS